MKGTSGLRKYADENLSVEERKTIELSRHDGLESEEDAVKKASTLIYIDLNDLCKKGAEVKWDSLQYDISLKEIEDDSFCCRIRMKVVAGILSRKDTTLFICNKNVVSPHNIEKAVKTMIEYYKSNVLGMAAM